MQKKKFYLINISIFVIVIHAILLNFVNKDNNHADFKQVSTIKVHFISLPADNQDNKLNKADKTQKNIQQNPSMSRAIDKVDKPLKSNKLVKPKILTTNNPSSFESVPQNFDHSPITQKINLPAKIEQTAPRLLSSPALEVKAEAQNNVNIKNINVNNQNASQDAANANHNVASITNKGITQKASYLGGLPPYPENARENNIEGTVVLKILLGENGKAKIVQISKSSSNSELDNAAKNFVAGAGNKFKPMIKNGEEVEIWIEQAIKFRLDAND